MPPEACDVRVTDCPLSMVGLDGEICPAIGAGFTVTVSLGEQTEAGELAESVTL